jgi:Zn finger protein HypA/HybF involved in hydrogenase expression
MHETHLFKNLIAYLNEEERVSRRGISKIHVELSEFGGLSSEHFMEHYRAGCKGTRWEHLEIEFSRVPYGPEFSITRIEYAPEPVAASATTRSRM